MIFFTEDPTLSQIFLTEMPHLLDGEAAKAALQER